MSAGKFINTYNFPCLRMFLNEIFIVRLYNFITRRSKIVSLATSRRLNKYVKAEYCKQKYSLFQISKLFTCLRFLLKRQLAVILNPEDNTGKRCRSEYSIMIAYRADNWLIFQADKRNDNRVTLPSAKKIVTFLKIPAFKDSPFWRFPLLEIPRFKDSRF